MSDTQAASPEFPEQLGQLAKFYRVMGFKPEEIQVVINDPEARAIVQRKWQNVCYPTEVRLAARIFAGAGLPLQSLHQEAHRLELAIFLSALHSDNGNVLDLRLGLSRGAPLDREQIANELGITPDEVDKRHAAALSVLRQHVQQHDWELASKLPIGDTDAIIQTLRGETPSRGRNK